MQFLSNPAFLLVCLSLSLILSIAFAVSSLYHVGCCCLSVSVSLLICLSCSTPGCVCLSICVSGYLSVLLCVCLSIPCFAFLSVRMPLLLLCNLPFPTVSIARTVHCLGCCVLSISFCSSVSPCLFPLASVCLCVCLSVSLCLGLCVCLFLCQLPVYPRIICRPLVFLCLCSFRCRSPWSLSLFLVVCVCGCTHWCVSWCVLLLHVAVCPSMEPLGVMSPKAVCPSSQPRAVVCACL